MRPTRSLGRLALLALPVTTVALATSAHAETFLVDFGNDASFRGVTTANPDSKGHYWTSNQPGSLSTNLLDINGATTTRGLGWDTPVATDSYNGPAGATSFPHPSAGDIANANAAIAGSAAQAALGNLAIGTAVIDFAASSSAGSPCVFDLQGLDVTQKYTLRLYGSHIFSANQQTTYTVGSGLNPTTFALTGLLGSASINVDEIDMNDPGLPPNIPNTTKVGVISNLTPNASGQLFINIAGAQGDLGYLNALEVIGTPAPEPTSLGLLGLAGGALFSRRRRA